MARTRTKHLANIFGVFLVFSCDGPTTRDVNPEMLKRIYPDTGRYVRIYSSRESRLEKGET
ncbi:hypothetical protein RUM44_007019 [Polyplax serrata]|uniref:Uncharacterized protein n=1 Tax=Polyplax serrata TaxID=468196 RepID=A0ABR1AZK1_POLSC